jgi:hypothetical protein
MITVGIDLAAQPDGTAACRIEWYADRAELCEVSCPLADDAVINAFESADRVGIDVPFGWPDQLPEVLKAYRDTASWNVAAASTNSLFFRATDLHVKAVTGKTPLAVGADRIAWPAARAARLLTRAAAAGYEVDRSGVQGVLVEVYPAVALVRWGLLPKAGYKGVKKRRILAELAERVLDRPWLSAPDAFRARCVSDDNVLDAFVGALVARAHALGLCETVPHGALERARREGWIAIPVAGSLDKLVAADPS